MTSSRDAIMRQLLGYSESTKNSHEEDKIQKTCVLWFRYQFPQLSKLLFHVNNEAYMGRDRTKTQREHAGRMAKDMGVVAGVADLIFLHPGAKGEHALCIEMKTSKGRQSDSQKLWQKAVEEAGYAYSVCRSVDDFKTIIKNYLSI